MSMRKFRVSVNGNTYDVLVEELGADAVPATAAPKAAAPAAVPAAPATASGSVTVEAPMPGNILDIKVDAGQSVEAGEILLILEAMKMENEIVAPVAGTVASVHVNKGDSVETGSLLVSMN